MPAPSFTIVVETTSDLDPADQFDPVDPAPVFAHIDLADTNNSTGDGSRWEMCRIEWSCTPDDSNGNAADLDNLPSHYRYVTDPRPFMNNAQIDLFAESWKSDTSSLDNVGKVRGFNMAWILTAGDWIITCRVTNPEGTFTVVTGTVTINAATGDNARDQHTINNAGGADYTSLAAALADNNQFSLPDQEYLIAGGHTETASARMNISGSNAWVHWNRQGARPAITCQHTDSRAVALESNGAVCEGLSLIPDPPGGTGAITGEYWGMRTDGNFLAVLDCHFNGTPDMTFIECMQDRDGQHQLYIGCTKDESERHGWTGAAHDTPRIGHIVAIGLDMTKSTGESIFRANAEPHYLNVLYSKFDNSEQTKGPVRLSIGKYHHVYGVYIPFENIHVGRSTDESDASVVRTVRIEACKHDDRGPFITQGPKNVCVVNNIYEVIAGDGALLLSAHSHSTLDKGLENIEYIANTIWANSGAHPLDITTVTGGGRKLEPGFIANGYIRACVSVLGASYSASEVLKVDTGHITGSATEAGWQDNRYTDPADLAGVTNFRKDGSDDTYTFTDWEQQSETTGEALLPQGVTLDTATFKLSENVPVDVPAGVYDDAYGNPRTVGGKMTAGAVELALAWSTLTADQWGQMTADDWAQMQA